MLMPSPEVQKRLEEYQTIDAVEEKALKLEWRRAKRRNRLIRTFAGLALIGSGVNSYAQDVFANQAIEASASVTVELKGKALDESNNDKGLIFIDGFGTDNADSNAKFYGEAIQPVIDGRLLSVDYNNAPLDPVDIAEEIIDTVVPLGINTVSFVGHSAGGDIAMLVQEELRKNSMLTIESIILISTPNGVESLRQARQNEIDLIKWVEWIPGVEYSSPIRLIGELAMRADSYTHGKDLQENIDNFFTTKENIQTNLDNENLPGMWLMFDQKLAIENADLQDRINKIAELPPDTIRPTIIYLGSKPYDPIVNTEKSAEEIGGYIKDTDIPYFVYEVPGAVHSRPDINEGYITTLEGARNEIRASIKAQQTKAALYGAQDILTPSGTPK